MWYSGGRLDEIRRFTVCGESGRGRKQRHREAGHWYVQLATWWMAMLSGPAKPGRGAGLGKITVHGRVVLIWMPILVFLSCSKPEEIGSYFLVGTASELWCTSRHHHSCPETTSLIEVESHHGAWTESDGQEMLQKKGLIIYISNFSHAQPVSSSNVGTGRFWDLEAHFWKRLTFVSCVGSRCSRFELYD